MLQRSRTRVSAESSNEAGLCPVDIGSLQRSRTRVSAESVRRFAHVFCGAMLQRSRTRVSAESIKLNSIR